MAMVDSEWIKDHRKRMQRAADNLESVARDLRELSDTPSKRDRITITLTEREAELVRELLSKCCCTGHTWALYDTLADVDDSDGPSTFDFVGFPRLQTYGPDSGYAHAERVTEVIADSVKHFSAHTEPRIRLTMDRDVAVTLKDLVSRVQPRRELDDVFTKLTLVDVLVSETPRFTGTISWKKRLLTGNLKQGEAYRLVKTDPTDAAEYEWEPVEE